MAKKQRSETKLIVNRRARFDYEIIESIWAGIVLTGPEVRAVRDGRVSLRGSYATTRAGELWLTNAAFSIVTNGTENVTDTSSKKLLVKKKEFGRLLGAKDNGNTIIPLAMTTNTRFIKVEIAIAKGKKLYDKRQTIKRRDSDRDAQRELARRDRKR